MSTIYDSNETVLNHILLRYSRVRRFDVLPPSAYTEIVKIEGSRSKANQLKHLHLFEGFVTKMIAKHEKKHRSEYQLFREEIEFEEIWDELVQESSVPATSKSVLDAFEAKTFTIPGHLTGTKKTLMRKILRKIILDNEDIVPLGTLPSETMVIMARLQSATEKKVSVKEMQNVLKTIEWGFGGSSCTLECGRDEETGHRFVVVDGGRVFVSGPTAVFE